MSYSMTETERNGALNLNSEYRYDLFVSKVFQHGLMWTLKGPEGLLFLAADDNEHCLPVWPHEDFAQLWAQGEFAGFEPQSITLEIWQSRWVDGLTQDNISLAVFPLLEQENLIIEAAELNEAFLKKQNPEK